MTRVKTGSSYGDWGQISTCHSDRAARVMHRQVAPWALGKDVSDRPAS
ncbi:MAG: hypothetical protein AAGD96_04415 [Chloroflexota bacterium]